MSPASPAVLIDTLPIAAAYHKARAKTEQVAPWADFARPEQLPPGGDWRTWLILAGRGWGKSRTGAETLCDWVEQGKAHKILVVAQTAADARDISVDALCNRIVRVDGPGQVVMAPRPGVHYEPSKTRVVWDNGATAKTFSADDPDSIRGYEGDTAWLDELAAWRRPEAYDLLQPGLRVGWARQIVTTTPRPTKLIRSLIDDQTTVTVRGRTLDNRDNLSPSALTYLLARYEGTRLGRQELDGELLEGDAPGALWSHTEADGKGVILTGEPPLTMVNGQPGYDLKRVIVGVDPAVTSGENADDTGIVVAGIGADGYGYVLDDQSCHLSPEGWARRVVGAYHEHRADAVVAEANNGGDLVKIVIHQADPSVPVRLVWATRGKETRAQPVAQLYEQRRIRHVRPFGPLEDQMCGWEPGEGESPDRVDALVWTLTELFFRSGSARSTSYMPSTTPPVIRRGDLVLVGERYVDKEPGR